MTINTDHPVTPDAQAQAEAEAATVTAKKRGGGPRTPEGKEQSKRNALTHSLLARKVLDKDLAAAVAARLVEFRLEFAPASPYEDWLVGEIALGTAKLDRYKDLMLVDHQRCIDRAKLCWDSDRREFIEKLGARLPKEPSRVAGALERTKQGVDWLLKRWQGLGSALQTNGGWDEVQRTLAFDLLGEPFELRHGSLLIPAPEDTPGLVSLVDGEVGRLRQSLDETLLVLDEAAMSLAACGMAYEEDALTKRLRGYEGRIRGALNRAQAELRRVRAEGPGGVGSHASAWAPGADEAEEEESPRPYATGAAADHLIRRAEMYGTRGGAGPVAEEPAVAEHEHEHEPEPAAPAVDPVPAAPLVAEAPAPEPAVDAEPWDLFDPTAIAAAAIPYGVDPDFEFDVDVDVSAVAAPGIRKVSLASVPTRPDPRNRRERLARTKQARQAALRGSR